MIKLLLITIIGLSLTACATVWDTKLYDSYKEGSGEAHEYAFLTVDSKADAIAKLAECNECTLAEAMLLKVIISRDIASIEAPSYSVKAPTLNTENVGIIAEVITSGIPFITIGKIISDTSGEIGDENYSSEGGDITVEKTEVHATALGDSNEVSTGYANDTLEGSQNDGV